MRVERVEPVGAVLRMGATIPDIRPMLRHADDEPLVNGGQGRSAEDVTWGAMVIAYIVASAAIGVVIYATVVLVKWLVQG